MAAQKKKHRKRGGIFYAVYFCFVLLGAGAIYLMMNVLWDNMADYEASMPKYVAQDVEKIFTSRDFETIYSYDDLTLCQAEGKEAYLEYLERLTAGYEITCREKFSENPDEKAYQVKFGSNKLAVFTLCKAEEKTAFGNDIWQLKDITTSVIRSTDYRITVPESSKVYADGVLLGADAVVESGLELTDSYLPEGYEHEKWQTYQVSRCFSIPAFSVSDAKGREQSFMPDESGRLVASLNYDDEELRPQYEEKVIKSAKAFALFTSDDCSDAYVMKHVLPDSKAARYISGFDGGWFMAHEDIFFRNMRTENYVAYEDGRFSCNVYFDYEIEYRKTTETYPTAYTFFFEQGRKECLIFDFITLN